MRSSKGSLRSSLPRRIGLLLVAAVALGFVAAVLSGSPARANPGVGTPASPTSCPNQGYNTSSTLANCRPTTTTGSQTLTLTVSYRNGQLKWQACAGAGAQGSTVQLYVDGNAVDSRTIEGNGCTSGGNTRICLSPGQHEATATDAQFGLVAHQQFNVQDSGCKNPTVASASSGQAGAGAAGSSPSGSRGFLAFTGADIALLVVGAGVLLALGYAILRMSRQRRSAA
jgi:hypothetical protein